MNEDRKKVWVNQFQTKLFLRITVYWLIYQVAVLNFQFIWRLVQEGPGNPLEQYWNFMLGYLPTLLMFLVLVPFLAWDAVRFAHRLVGPLVRFSRAMEDITAGKPVRRIKLRKGDFQIDMQNEFNNMLAALEARGVRVIHPGDALSSQDNSAPVQK